MRTRYTLLLSLLMVLIAFMVNDIHIKGFFSSCAVLLITVAGFKTVFYIFELDKDEL